MYCGDVVGGGVRTKELAVEVDYSIMDVVVDVCTDEVVVEE